MTQPDGPTYGVEPPPVRPPHLWPIPVFPPEILPEKAPEQAVCLQCGYQIRGLATTGKCPECGTPIARSLRGNLLEYSSTEYVKSLHVGLTIALIAAVSHIVLSILMMIGTFVIVLQSGGAPRATPNVYLWYEAALLPVTAAQLCGWWMFSAPDPAIVGTETGQKARSLIRIAVAAQAGVTLFSLLIRAITIGRPEIVALAGAISILGRIASIVQFFASMLYLRWLAPRLPDKKLHDDAQRNIWLLPVIYIAGLCVVIGPIVAMVMYLLMLNRFRFRLALIRHRQLAAMPAPI